MALAVAVSGERDRRRNGAIATIQFQANRKVCSADSGPARPLLEVLREKLPLTGTNYGCGEGQYGACATPLDGRPVTSHLARVEPAADRNLIPIEGLEHNGRLRVVRLAFPDEGAMQCGSCIPARVLRTTVLREGHADPTEAQMIEELNGNLCRCRGYPRIVAAVKRAAAMQREGRKEANSAA